MIEYKQQIKFTNEIDFEKDQQDAMKKTENIQSLADQVEKVRVFVINQRLELQEENIKNKKSEIQRISGDIYTNYDE